MMTIRGNLRSSGRVKRLLFAATVAAGGAGWALVPSVEAGWLRCWNEARGSHAAARVIAASGPARTLGGGRSRPVAAGSVLGAGEVIVTGKHSILLVETADGSRYEIFPESRVRFPRSGWRWLAEFNRGLVRIKARIQGLERFAAPDRLSSPTAVLAVRAAIRPTSGRDAVQFGTSRIETWS